MSEDYDIKTGTLLIRRFRRRGAMGGEGRWEFEVGLAPSIGGEGNQMISESFSNPIFSRVDTSVHFQWRVRNLSYPKSNYLVSCEKDEIIVRTVNKKYFKRISIGDMVRCDISLDPKALSFDHANNTLIISYKKPPAILALEKKVWQEISGLKANEDGQIDCAQS